MVERKVAIFASLPDYAPVQQLLRILANSSESFQVKGIRYLNPATTLSHFQTADWVQMDWMAVQDSTQHLQGYEAALLFIQPTDLAQTLALTRGFVAVTNQMGIEKLGWIAPAAAGDSEVGRQLKEAEASIGAVPKETLRLHHAPLFSELLRHKSEIKFRRTLSLPLDHRPLPWLAPEAIAAACYQWLSNQGPVPSLLVGPAPLTGADIAATLSEVLHQTVNGRTFAQRRFTSIDLDGSGQLDLQELMPYLIQIGCSREEAEEILQKADTNADGRLDYTEFIEKLEDRLATVLTEVPTTVEFVPLSPSAGLHDSMAKGMTESAARAWMELLVSLNVEGMPQPPQETLDRWELGNLSLADWASQYALDWINVHVLPGYGITMGQEGLLEGRPALFSRILHIDGRRLLSQRTLDFQIVEIHWADVDPASVQIVHAPAQDRGQRALHLCNGHLVGVSVRGLWSGLRLASLLLLSQQPLPPLASCLVSRTGGTAN